MGRSGPGGSFTARTVRVGDLLSAQGEGFVCAAGHRVSRDEPATIVCGPGLRLAGIVLESDERPVSGARVVLGQAMGEMLRAASGGPSSVLLPHDTVSDSAGLFELAVPIRDGALSLDVEIERVVRLRAEIPLPLPEFLELRLPPESEGGVGDDRNPGWIAGFVRGLDGGARASWSVHAFPSSERLDLLRSLGSAHTDSEGAFEIDGLAQGSLSLVAFDPLSLRRTDAETYDTGTHGAVLTERPLQGHPIQGAVQARDGTPLAGVRVFALPEGLSADVVEALDWVPRTASDASGAFAFERDLDSGVTLVLTGSSVATTSLPLAAAPTDARGVRHFRVDRLCRVRIHLPETLEADALEFRGGLGESLRSVLRTANLELRLSVIPWTNGTEIEALVPESGSSLAVLRGGVEVLSRALVLDLEHETEVFLE